MIYLKWLATFSALVLLVTPLQGQRRSNQNRFDAGIIVGLTASQINGDRYSGFNKVGGFVGLRAMVRLNASNEFGVEILYSNKGSKNPEQPVPGKPSRFLALDYIEVPVFYRKKIATAQRIYNLEIGLSYARLIGIRINERANNTSYATFTAIKDDFNTSEVAIVLGGGVVLNEHIHLIGRFSPSLTLLYENENPITTSFTTGTITEFSSLRNLQLLFGVNYVF